MTKSKLYGLKARRLGALERLEKTMEWTKQAMDASKDIKAEYKKYQTKMKGYEQNWEHLDAKKHYSKRYK